MEYCSINSDTNGSIKEHNDLYLAGNQVSCNELKASSVVNEGYSQLWTYQQLLDQSIESGSGSIRNSSAEQWSPTNQPCSAHAQIFLFPWLVRLKGLHKLLQRQWLHPTTSAVTKFLRNSYPMSNNFDCF